MYKNVILISVRCETHIDNESALRGILDDPSTD